MKTAIIPIVATGSGDQRFTRGDRRSPVSFTRCADRVDLTPGATRPFQPEGGCTCQFVF